MIQSLYVHIPFCKHKCNYCDFVSYAGKEGLIDEYVEALIREIRSHPLSISPLVRGRCSEGTEGVRTIYFGGGTPTLLEARHFNKIISTIIGNWSLPACRTGRDIGHSEISAEANPGTADKAKLKALRQMGINRLSIGVQSFNDTHLKTLGRIHTAEEAIRFYENARSAGFNNINLDLIFALPDQTLEEWKADLQTAVALRPEHLSTYNLQIEENTPLWRAIQKLPGEETELQMYEYTIESLTAAGYKHYEISNFARPGFECKHNINYWKNGNYIGLGTGAHSHVDGRRWSNPPSIEEYISTPFFFLPLSKGEMSERSEDRGGQSETIFMGLRLLEGLEIEKFVGFEKEVFQLVNDGLLIKENNHYKLTRQGLFLGNLVFEKFV